MQSLAINSLWVPLVQTDDACAMFFGHTRTQRGTRGSRGRIQNAYCKPTPNKRTLPEALPVS